MFRGHTQVINMICGSLASSTRVIFTLGAITCIVGLEHVNILNSFKCICQFYESYIMYIIEMGQVNTRC